GAEMLPEARGDLPQSRLVQAIRRERRPFKNGIGTVMAMNGRKRVEHHRLAGVRNASGTEKTTRGKSHGRRALGELRSIDALNELAGRLVGGKVLGQSRPLGSPWTQASVGGSRQLDFGRGVFVDFVPLLTVNDGPNGLCEGQERSSRKQFKARDPSDAGIISTHAQTLLLNEDKMKAK
ncbi:hypothetical protein DFH06DRAFT_1117898, partial [Mycena polygramma]